MNTKPVTIESVRSHGVRRLLVYCRGKREGDWPCHHEATLPIERFHAAETIEDIERRCRCTTCGWRKAHVRPDYNKPLPPHQRRLGDAAINLRHDIHRRGLSGVACARSEFFCLRLL